MGDGADDEDIDRSSRDVAMASLDQLATYLPSKHVFQSAINITMASIQGGNLTRVSSNLLALASIVEGCFEAFESNSRDILLLVKSCVEIEDKDVRCAACFFIQSLCRDLSDDFLAVHHGFIVPLIFESLRDSRKEVNAFSLLALETLCEKMDAQTISIYMDTIMNNILPSLSSSDLAIQCRAVAVICSVAIASQAAFIRFVDYVFPRVRELASNPADDRVLLRGEAIQCIGHIAVAVGGAKFGPVVMDVMKIASQCLEVENVLLTEYVFNFLGSVAECLGEVLKIF